MTSTDATTEAPPLGFWAIADGPPRPPRARDPRATASPRRRAGRRRPTRSCTGCAPPASASVTRSRCCCRTRPRCSSSTSRRCRPASTSCPINWHLVGPEIAYIVQDCEAKAFVAHARFADAAQAAADEIDFPATTGFAVGGDIPGFRSYDELKAGQPTTRARGPHDGRVDELHVGHDGQAEGRAPPAAQRAARGDRRRQRRDAVPLRAAALRRQRAPLRLAAVPHGRARSSPAARSTSATPSCSWTSWTPEGMLELIARYQRHEHAHGADPVRPPARPARRREGALRRVVAAPHGPRRRAVPTRREAGDARVVGPRDLRVLRRDRGRRDDRLRRTSGSSTPARSGTPWPISEVVILDDDGNELPPRRGRHRLHAHADRQLRVLQGQGEDGPEPAGEVLHRRRRRRTSTRTAGCSSATARPT